MAGQQRYRPNEPHVISEILDGELIILNFERGIYYSARDGGLAIWRMLAAGHSADEIGAALRARFGDAAPAVAEDVGRFVSTLADEGLVVPAEEAGAGPATDVGAILDGQAEYAPPTLERHADLQDLLLLDPIHDVDSTGWPHRPA